MLSVWAWLRVSVELCTLLEAIRGAIACVFTVERGCTERFEDRQEQLFL